MEDSHKQELRSVIHELTTSQKRKLRRVLLATKDEGADYLNEEILLAVLKIGEYWWLNDPIKEALES